MEQVQELAQQGGGNWFSYLMGMIIIYHLYKQIKDKGLFDKLESKLDELKAKLDK